MSAEKITEEVQWQKTVPALVELLKAWNEFIYSTASVAKTPTQAFAAVALTMDSLFHSFVEAHIETIKERLSQAETAADAPEKTEGGAE